MTVTVFSLDDARIIDIRRGLSPRKAHRYMRWLKHNAAHVYWTCHHDL